MPIYIQEDELLLSGGGGGGSDDDIVVVDDERVGMIGHVIGKSPTSTPNPPIVYRVVGSNYTPTGDEILMTRAVANDSGFNQINEIPPNEA